jgi:hypothetical protein
MDLSFAVKKVFRMLSLSQGSLKDPGLSKRSLNGTS